MKQLRLWEEDGFSTLGMVVALLLTLSLMFTTAQVYRVNTESAAVQDVADAAALAAENEVAEFVLAAKACDAVILTLTLTSFAATGLGVAALCTPVTGELSAKLLEAGRTTLKARDTFAQRAAEGLDALQSLLPFLAAINALQVVSANNGNTGRHTYAALAVIVPDEGAVIEVPGSDEAAAAQDRADAEADTIRRAAKDAEEAAKQAMTAKQTAFDHDCGLNPSYCMYERAETLADLSGASNPLYSSVDAWSFSVALERARAYYAARFRQEQPSSSSVADQVRSVMRKRFYGYASERLEAGYVHQTDDSFDAYFPMLPRNTQQMRETSLYVEACYPITAMEDGFSMHAWDGCPQAGGIVSYGSISQMEAGGFVTCPTCGFTAESLGNVASASTNVENGFEYHYAVVAQQVADYKAAMDMQSAPKRQVKNKAGSLLGELVESFAKVANKRLMVDPPGSKGVIALVADTASSASSAGFENGFVSSSTVLGTRAAVSGATLLADPSGEGPNAISSILDNVRQKGGLMVGGLNVVLDCWANLLGGYGRGQEALRNAVEVAIGAIPFASASGLGTWASKKLSDLSKEFGLQPINLDALRPVLVNTSYVAQSDQGSFCVGFQSVKRTALDIGASGGVFDYLVGRVKDWAVGRIPDEVQIAVIEPLGTGGPSIPLVIKLPPTVKEGALEMIDQASSYLRGVVPWGSGLRVWE